MFVLGLDLGISSIGWACTQENGGDVELSAWGSRIFEPGMEDDISSGKGVSRCANRRTKKAMRIQYRRRRLRKDILISILTKNKMLPEPLTADFFTKIDNRLLLSFPVDFRRQISHVLPYLYRKKALDCKLDREELGRTIFHLAQRRGYLSNRKLELKNAEDSGVVKSGIRQLRDEMAKVQARTLGEYFSMIDPEESRIRTRYTDRSMYEDEFRMICKAQRELIPEDLEKALYKAIFFQRKLKSCKHLVGKCCLYPDKQRCSYMHEEAQMFRLFTTVNHLRIAQKENIRSLTEEERGKIIEILNGFSGQLNANGTIALSKLARAVSLGKGEKFTLSDDEKEIYGNQLHAFLYRIFGEQAADMPQDLQQKFLNDLASVEKNEILVKRLSSCWKLPEEKIDEALRLPLPDDYCAYSLKALREILPDLSAGIALKTIEKADHPHSFERPKDLLPRLDSEDYDIDLRNPLVHRVLTELRRVVNAIIIRYGKPDLIRIELARDLKNTNKERERITRLNRDHEKERASIAKKIAEEAGIENPSKNDILKVMLAEECDFTCPYTGTRFSMYDLLHGKDIHIEHILPFSRSFDDSFRNKTLCIASANAKKNNRMPSEAFHGDEYQAILTRVSHFKGPFAEIKKELFEKTEIDEGFINRNLNDTRYASKLAMQYLGTLYGGIIDPNGKQRIFAIAGGCTALIRRAWGGNYLLGEGEKVRSDHRHHAIDALTIALTTPQLVRQVASMTPEDRRKIKESARPCVYAPLFDQASQKLADAAVSHHVINKMRGELHYQGKFYSKDYGKTERHVRTKLVDLTPRDIPLIVDPAIRASVTDKLLALSPDGKITSASIKIFNDDKNLPSLKTKDGTHVNTIKYVRVKQNVKTRSIGSGDHKREVKNGENYLLAVFAELDDRGNEKAWTGEIVTLSDAVNRKIHGEPLFQKEQPGLKFKFTLKKGDIVSWEKDGQSCLCIIRGISLPQFYMVPIRDARMQKELKSAKMWFTPTLTGAFSGHLKKYQMNVFGELRDAHD